MLPSACSSLRALEPSYALLSLSNTTTTILFIVALLSCLSIFYPDPECNFAVSQSRVTARVLLSGHRLQFLVGCRRVHQPGETAHKEIDAQERSDGPYRTGRPGLPDQVG